jgi:hypothetical protein
MKLINEMTGFGKELIKEHTLQALQKAKKKTIKDLKISLKH